MAKENKKKNEITNIDKRKGRRYIDAANKLNNILREMRLTTFKRRIKIKLLEEYSNGRFFDIPFGLLDMNQKFDKEVIKDLQNKFENSKNIPTFIPENLYDLKNSEEVRRVRSIMEGKGVYVSLDLEELSLLPHNSVQKRELLDFTQRNFDEKKYSNRKEDDLNLIVENVKKATDAGNSSEGKEIIYNQENQGVYERKLYVYLMEVFHGVTTILGRDIGKVLEENIKNLDETYIGNKISIQRWFLRKRDDFIRRIGNSSSKDDVKDTVFSIIDVLKECGALDELIEKENKTLNYLNNFLPQESRLDNFDEEDVRNDIELLDVNKLEELQFLLLNNRHFANKIAHVYEDYMFTNLFVNTLDFENNLPSIKEKQIAEHFGYIDKFISEKFYDLDDSTKERLKNVFVEKTLKLSSEYFTKNKLFDDNKEDVFRRMKIALILNPTQYERENFKSLENKEKRINKQEYNKLRACLGSNDELDEIIKKILGDDESKVLKHIEETKYKKTREEAESIKNKISEIADKIIENRTKIIIGNQIIRDIAISKGKNVDFESVTHASNLNIEETIAFYGLTKEEVLSGLCNLAQCALSKLPEDIRKLPFKHNAYKEGVKNAQLRPEERILLDGFSLKSEKNADDFLKKMMDYHNELKESKENIIDLCDKPMIKNYSDKPMIKNCSEKVRYCKDLTDKFKGIIDDYYEYMTREVELGIREKFPSAFRVISLLMQTDSAVYDYYKTRDNETKMIIEDVKNIKIERNFAQFSFVDLVKEFEDSVKKDGVVRNIYDVFTSMAGQVDLDKKLFKVKHKATTELLNNVKNNPNILVEGHLPTEYKDGLINILVSGGYQKNSCHNKYAELPDLREKIDVEEPEIMEQYYKQEKGNKIPLNTYIYKRPISNVQMKGFQTVAKIIGSIDGKYTLRENELDEEAQGILNSLKELKEKNPIQYGSLTPRFLLGAGIDYYRSYYGSIDKKFEKVVEDEERILEDRILSETIEDVSKTEDEVPKNDLKYAINERFKKAIRYERIKKENRRIISIFKGKCADKEEK